MYVLFSVPSLPYLKGFSLLRPAAFHFPVTLRFSKLVGGHFFCNEQFLLTARGLIISHFHTDAHADEISALVLDPGYSVTRAGFAGEDAPKSVIPTFYARKDASAEPLFDDTIVYNPFPSADVGNPRVCK